MSRVAELAPTVHRIVAADGLTHRPAPEDQSFMSASKATILHPEFAARLEAVCNTHPDVPPSNYGRLGWFADEFTKRGDDVSKEMVRKYLAGENKPREARMAILAEILGVDVAWLSLGKSTEAASKRAVVRNAQVAGVVNVVAGLIEMHGGSPAFPDEGDSRAERDHIDLYAIIRGAQYAVYVALAIEDGDGFKFHLPPGMGQDTVVLGVIQTAPFGIDIIELDAAGRATHGTRGKTGMDVAVDRKYRTGDYPWQKVETFAKRL